MKGLSHEQRRQLKRDIVEYRKQGHYASECAEHFGVKLNYVHNACHGIDYPWKHDTETMSKAAKKQAEERTINEQTPIKYVEKFAPWAEYVGGYTNCDGYMQIRCKTCGAEFNRSVVAIRHGDSKRCKQCERNKLKAKREAEAKRKQSEAESKRFERINRFKHKQIGMRVCKCCGSMFADARRSLYCSDECAKRLKNAISKDRRLRKIKSIKRDEGITLERLYEKHNGVCALCGNVCDWSDYIITDSNVFIANNNYPSIDHIIPLSKGGTHTWDNVQLACRICNSKKHDCLPLPIAQEC